MPTSRTILFSCLMIISIVSGSKDSIIDYDEVLEGLPEETRKGVDCFMKRLKGDAGKGSFRLEMLNALSDEASPEDRRAFLAKVKKENDECEVQNAINTKIDELEVSHPEKAEKLKENMLEMLEDGHDFDSESTNYGLVAAGMVLLALLLAGVSWILYKRYNADEKREEQDLEKGNASLSDTGGSRPAQTTRQYTTVSGANDTGTDIPCENGRTIQSFKIGKMLGVGGFGAVRVCTKHIDGAKYALKGCPVPDDIEVIKYSLREAQTMARMPEANNVIRYYDAWLEATTPELQDLFISLDQCKLVCGKRIIPKYILFMQLELCDTSLKAWINKREPRSVDDVWNIFRQIVEGLCYIHKLGFIHRDLKPANVLLSIGKDGRIRAKLGDLGLARSKERQLPRSSGESALSLPAISRYNSIMQPDADVSLGPGWLPTANPEVSVNITQCVGTLTYMAPEQMSSRNYTNKVDMYALGVVLFEMFSSFPNNDVRHLEIHQLKAQEKPPKRSQIHLVGENAVKLVSGLVAADQDKRLSALEVLNSELVPNAEPDMTPAVQAYLNRERKEIEKRTLQRVGMSLDAISENPASGAATPQSQRSQTASVPGTERCNKLFDCAISVDTNGVSCSGRTNTLSAARKMRTILESDEDSGVSFEVVEEF